MVRVFSLRAGGIVLAAVVLVAIGYFYLTAGRKDAPVPVEQVTVLSTGETTGVAGGGGEASDTREKVPAADNAAEKQAADAALAEQARTDEAEAAKRAADEAQAAADKLAEEKARIAIERAAEEAQAAAEAAASNAQAAADAAAAEAQAVAEARAAAELALAEQAALEARTEAERAVAEKQRLAAENGVESERLAAEQAAREAEAAVVVTEPQADPVSTPDMTVTMKLPSDDGAPAQATVGGLTGARPDAPASGLASVAAPDVDPTRAATDIAAPSFDLVRVAPDGGSIIAGRAQPNATVEITADGQVIGTATADARGEFVAMLDTPASEKPLSLGLISRGEGGERTASVTNVLILSNPLTEPDAGDEANQAPIILRETEDRIEIIQPAPLPVPDQIVIDSIGYDREGAVEISGRGRPTFQVRLYMNGRFVERAEIGDDGVWSVRLSEVAAGLYTLRVDEVDDDGVVASRAETPFQRIFPDQLPDVDASGTGRYTVQPGNNLWTIAKNRYGEGLDYWQIFRANRKLIRDPDLIYPGQVFALPD